ncbi:MAG: response regulator [Nitrospirota bacterium]
MKILIVDDNSDDRKLLKYNLERHNCTTLDARDGVEGLELALAHKPGLIISDALMPRMDGFQFLRAVKSDETLRSIPFVFYSATYIGDKDIQFALSLGAAAYIVKPKEPDEFWKELNGIIECCRIKLEIPETSVTIGETEFIKKHSEIIAAKLEKKILELQELNAKLEQSEAFIRNILESVDEGFIVIDPAYRIVSANRAFLDMVDLPAEKVVGRHCHEITHNLDEPCSKSGIDCAVKHTFETGRPKTATHVHRKGDSPSCAETKAYPMKNAAGEIISVIEIVNDITEKCKLEEQLRHAQKMEAVGQLAAGISHDFNNILSAIIGFAYIMQLKMNPNDPLKKDVGQILAAAEKAANLTRSLLAFSSRQTSKPSPVNLNDIIRRIEKLLLKIISEGQELRIKLTDKNVTLMADAGQLEQVLMNLAANGRDAMPGGGTLSVSTDVFNMDSDFVRTHGYGIPGTYVLLTVADTGKGIEKGALDHIFEPFFTTKDAGKGTGLGLSIVYGIVKQHGGFIYCYSQEGQGTSFKIYLPLLGAQDAQSSSAVCEIAPAGGTETILLGEDDAIVRKLMKEILEDMGYSVIEAENGEVAVDKFKQHRDKIGLLVLDMIMPKKSGKDAYEEIKKIRTDIKVLFTSGYPGDYADKSGIIGTEMQFILKPVHPPLFLKKVREVLDS